MNGIWSMRVCHVPALVPSMMCLVDLGRFVQEREVG